MIVKFETGLGVNLRSDQWALKAVPRVGDGVYLQGRMFEVTSVQWILTDDDGKPLRSIYARVFLR